MNIFWDSGQISIAEVSMGVLLASFRGFVPLSYTRANVLSRGVLRIHNSLTP